MSSITSTTQPIVRKPISDSKLAANRANALRSTGPRTAAGKRIVARNALKHGLCTNTAVLPGECEATYNTLHGELRQDLRPRTSLQNLLVQRITNLYWKLIRLQDAEVHLYDLETLRCDPDRADDPAIADPPAPTIPSSDLPISPSSDLPTAPSANLPISPSSDLPITPLPNVPISPSPDDSDSADPPLYPCEVLARRFSEDPDNAFVLLHRYEQALQRELRALLSRYAQVQKRWPRTPYDDDEIFPPRRRGFSEQTQIKPTAEFTTCAGDKTSDSDDDCDSAKQTQTASPSAERA